LALALIHQVLGWQWQYVPAHDNGIIYLPPQQCL